MKTTIRSFIVISATLIAIAGSLYSQSQQIVDFDDNYYDIVTIGSQVWMAENLEVFHYTDGTIIPYAISPTEWGITTEGSGTYSYSEWESSYGDTYGKLYNYYAVVDIRNLCPADWHVPTRSDWSTLIGHLGGSTVAGGPLKESGTTHWLTPNTDATNASGFTALPAGEIYRNGAFWDYHKLGEFGGFWSSTDSSINYGWGARLRYNSESAHIVNNDKRNGLSVRCVHDGGSVITTPGLTTENVTSITATSAESGGIITVDGNSSITSKGICWSDSPNPTLADASTDVGPGSEVFTSTLYGLSPNETIYIRAYATNGMGTAYGDEVSFTTITELAQDSLALVDLYNSTGGTMWYNSANWLSTLPIDDWYGVTVSGERVTALNLNKNNLAGTIPTSIGDLTALVSIDFWTNSLIGTIPQEIGNLTNLTRLYLNANNLEGPIPAGIGQLTNLTHLMLNGNQLTGPVPIEIADLTNLIYLYLSNNQLNGPIPPELGGMSSLVQLGISNNPLGGTIPPELGDLEYLEFLLLKSCQLEGTVPGVIWDLSNLTQLHLGINNLEGTIPPEIGNLDNLLFLQLYSNQFEGEIPSEIGNLTNLAFLNISSNRFVGSVPLEITGLTRLVVINIKENQFNSLPELSSLTNLDSLYVEDNWLTFEDIEPNIGFADESFTYSPQANIATKEDTTLYLASEMVFSVSAGGANSMYQWYKDSDAIGGSTVGNSLVIYPVNLSDAGEYRCEITNSVASELTLYSNPAILEVIDEILVSNKQNTGIGSLRAAIEYANSNAGEHTISFSIEGSGPHTIQPQSPLPIITDPLTIDGYTQAGSTTANETTQATLMIELDGINLIDDHDKSGLIIHAGNCTVKGLIINRFGDDGIHIEGPGGNTIEGNFIGVDHTGVVAKGNYDGALRIWDSPDNIIGGDLPEQRNVMASNRSHVIQILLTGAENNVVKGNYFGVGANGDTEIGTTEVGVLINEGAHHNTIGPDNTISGHTQTGIDIVTGNPHNNTIIGNYIGTNHDGTAVIGNGHGITITDASNNIIGGFVDPISGIRGQDGNIISGNEKEGIWIKGDEAISNVIKGNFIGLDANGSTDFGNGLNGVRIQGPFNNTVGGDLIGDGNIISGNGGSGVLIEYDLSGYGNRIKGNKIGTDKSGSLAMGNGTGINIHDASHVVLEKNMISGNETGINLGNNSSYNTVIGNRIGTGMQGKLEISVPNIRGIAVYQSHHNTIGGANPGEENVVSNNKEWGITISGDLTTDNLVIGNFIGTNRLGTLSMGNGHEQPDGFGSGIIILMSDNNTIGGSDPGAENVISANAHCGIWIIGQPLDEGYDYATGNKVLGNIIGTDISGDVAMGNHYGVQLKRATDNYVGESGSESGNLISGNEIGILLRDTADGNFIQGNLIGTDLSGTTANANTYHGIAFEGGDNNLVGGSSPAARNIISGNGEHGVYVTFSPDNDTATGNMIQGNFIGLDINGNVENPLGNGNDGIKVDTRYNIIGGSGPGEGNVISGNLGDGVHIWEVNAVGNHVLGNIIGLDSTGTEAVGNGSSGVRLNTCINNTLGGTATGSRNIISGNPIGVVIQGPDNVPEPRLNRVIGNYIGTDISGTESIGNSQGMFIGAAQENIIGGPTSRERNVISGNSGFGILLIDDSNNNYIKGNFIGTDRTGTKKVPNKIGVHVLRAQDNFIGGKEFGEGNLISGNTDDGILMYGAFADGVMHLASDNVVEGNYIGTDISGLKPLSNGADGIRYGGNADDNIIGGIHPGSGNLIAFNEGNGIGCGSGTGNSILTNSIHSNGVIGIDLLGGDPWVTDNDVGDGDVGSNNLQNYPVLNNVIFSSYAVDIEGALNSTPNTDYLLQYFANNHADPVEYGEGETYLGSESVKTDDDGNASFTATFSTYLRNGLVVTATATDPGGNTSEFSKAVGGAQTQIIPIENMPLHYVIQEDGVGYVDDNSDLDAILNAFQTWEDIPTAVLDFEYDGTTAQEKAVANDGINLITFKDETFFITDDVLGLAAKTIVMDGLDGEAVITDADIVFNPYWTRGEDRFGTDTYDGLFDLQSIVTHEIGHIFGLLHSGVLESTMFFSILDHNTDKRSLAQDDISWASYRYPNQEVYDHDFGSISGNITYGDDDQFPPVAGALILATHVGTGDAIHTYSDINGDYLVPGIPPGDYKISIEPLDGDVHGYPLTKYNISYYIKDITNYTDFPNEYYNSDEGAVDDPPEEFLLVGVTAGQLTEPVNLITNEDVTPPQVNTVSPKDDSIGVEVITQIRIEFSEAVNLSTFGDETCYLTVGDNKVFGSHTYLDNFGKKILFTTEPLDFETMYALHITSGVTDLKGNGLNGLFTSEFTTEIADDIQPVITDIIPDDGNESVFVNTDILVFFSEAMDESTTEAGFSLVDESGVKIEGSYDWEQGYKVLTFDPFNMLAEGETYTITVSEEMKDLAHNSVENKFESTFSIVPEANPFIILVGPTPAQDLVSIATPLVIDFSEPIDPQTANESTIQILRNDKPVDGEFEYLYNNSRVIFRPETHLKAFTTYDVVISDEIYDVSDPKLPLEPGKSYFFTTSDLADEPFIDFLEPSSGSIGAIVNIVGEGFDPNPEYEQVYFNGTDAIISYTGLNEITTKVPLVALEGMVRVDVHEKSSNEKYFYVIPPYDNPGDEISRTVGTTRNAEDVAILPDASFAYVTNSGADVVSQIDMETLETKTVKVGEMPVQIDIHPNGNLAYVTNHRSHDVSVIDLTKLEVVKTIPVGINPYGVVVTPDGTRLYVANYTSQDISVIDIDPNSGGYDQVVGSIKTTSSNTAIDISPDGALALVACNEGVLIINTDPEDEAYNEISRTVNTGSATSRVDIMPDAGMGVAVTDDGYIVLINIMPMSNDYGNIVGRISSTSGVSDINISPDGLFIYATNTEANTISVYELTFSGSPYTQASVYVFVGLELINTIKVDEAPYALVVDSRAEQVLVSHYTDDGQITIIDITGGTLDVITTLEDLIYSVIDAIDNGIIPTKNGLSMLKKLNEAFRSISIGKTNRAIDQLYSFIDKVYDLLEDGEIPPELGNTWIEVATKLILQLEKDMAEEDFLKQAQIDENSGDQLTNDGLTLLDRPEYLETNYIRLEQNHPNPFGLETRIDFMIPYSAERIVPVVMRLFNINGQVVKTLIHMDMTPGSYSVIWNGTYDDGGQVPEGMYMLELRTNDQRKVINLSVIK